MSDEEKEIGRKIVRLYDCLFGRGEMTKEVMTKDFVIYCLDLKAHSDSHTMPVNTEIPVYEKAIELLENSITFDELKEKINKYSEISPNKAGLFEATCKELGILKEGI